MALSQTMLKDCEAALAELLERKKKYAEGIVVDYRIKNQSIEIFECQPSSSNPQGFFEFSVAKVTFVNTKQRWNIYWMRGNLKWTSYMRKPHTKTIREALIVIGDDEDRLFWGTVVEQDIE